MRVCVYVCVSIVFLMLSRQLPYLQFHHKIFATNRSQIRVFSQDLIKYIMSLKNCNTICKKQEIKITKKKNNNIYQKIAKMHFLDNHKSEWEHEIKTIDPISFVKFILNLKIFKILFHVVPSLVHSDLYNTSIFD